MFYVQWLANPYVAHVEESNLPRTQVSIHIHKYVHVCFQGIYTVTHSNRNHRMEAVFTTTSLNNKIHGPFRPCHPLPSSVGSEQNALRERVVRLVLRPPAGRRFSAARSNQRARYRCVAHVWRQAGQPAVGHLHACVRMNIDLFRCRLRPLYSWHHGSWVQCHK